MSEEWKTMTTEQKSKYEKQCTEDKERYNKAMTEYLAKKAKEVIKRHSE